MSISLHTFELTLHCTNKEYNGFLKSICLQNNKSVIPGTYDIPKYNDYLLLSTTYTYSCYKNYGINRLILQTISDPKQKKPIDFLIKFVINPKRLLGENDNPYTTIIDATRLCDIPMAVDEFIHKLCPKFPNTTERCILSRIDYCVNFHFYTQAEADEYLKLLRKANLPRYFTPVTVYDTKKHRQSQRPGEMTVKCGSYELSMYLKRTQMYNSDYEYPIEELINATGQLRIELRSRRPQLYRFKNKEKLIQEMELLQIEQPINTIIKKLQGMYGTGDFFQLEDAKDLIDKSNYRQKTIDNMFHILDVVKKHKTLDWHKNGLDKDYLAKYLPYFNELGISPITVPVRSIHLTYPNPINYLTGATTMYIKATDLPSNN